VVCTSQCLSELILPVTTCLKVVSYTWGLTTGVIDVSMNDPQNVPLLIYLLSLSHAIKCSERIHYDDYGHLISMIFYCNLKFIATVNEECYILPLCYRIG
jgi:hypothetical protein